jgi:ABC-type nitrate/sulfonate/bicarbonate transport system substrate-binding protein
MALDKGYFKAEGLNVSIDTGNGSRESIPRVASGTYDIGTGAVNSLIRFRDENPTIDVKAIMMVYDRPPSSAAGAGVSPRIPRALLAKSSARLPPTAPMPYLFASLKVAITLAYVGAVIAESNASRYGIGNLITRASADFNVPLVFAALIALAILGVIIYAATVELERRTTGWAHRSGTSQG